jgi:serine/threonine-protein kinase
VFVVAHGDERDLVKVLDFGLVKSVDGDESEDVTRAGTFVGSPKYMSPEQIRGEHVDARADVYALGVVLYELLTGVVPFDRANQVDILLAHVSQAPIAPRVKAPEREIPEALEAIVLRCLEKDPAARFKDMDELLTALKAYDGGTRTGTTSAPNELRASLTAMVSSGTHSTSSSPPAASSISPDDPSSSIRAPAPSRSRAPLAIAASIALIAVVGLVVARQKSAQSAAPASNEPKPLVTQTTAPVEAPKVTPAASPSITSVAPPASSIDAHLITIETEPKGARVRDSSDALLCDATPCKVRLHGESMIVVVSMDGRASEKLKLSEGDGTRTVKLEKRPTWTAPKQGPATTATTATTDNGWKDNPYGKPNDGPY